MRRLAEAGHMLAPDRDAALRRKRLYRKGASTYDARGIGAQRQGENCRGRRVLGDDCGHRTKRHANGGRRSQRRAMRKHLETNSDRRNCRPPESRQPMFRFIEASYPKTMRRSGSQCRLLDRIPIRTAQHAVNRRGTNPGCRAEAGSMSLRQANPKGCEPLR
jgi:hypothetical protein